MHAQRRRGGKEDYGTKTDSENSKIFEIFLGPQVLLKASILLEEFACDRQRRVKILTSKAKVWRAAHFDGRQIQTQKFLLTVSSLSLPTSKR